MYEANLTYNVITARVHAASVAGREVSHVIHSADRLVGFRCTVTVSVTGLGEVGCGQGHRAVKRKLVLVVEHLGLRINLDQDYILLPKSQLLHLVFNLIVKRYGLYNHKTKILISVHHIFT